LTLPKWWGRCTEQIFTPDSPACFVVYNSSLISQITIIF
jgi:hypothetical protein